LSVSTSQSTSSCFTASPGFLLSATTRAERRPSPMIGTRTMMSLVPATSVFCGAWDSAADGNVAGLAEAGPGSATPATGNPSPRATLMDTVRQMASRMRGTSGSAAYS
jgi:hypothetical protein